MTSRDWFRRTTWSLEDERAFFSRLARSRSAFHKSQYLRIQALSLAYTGQEALVSIALSLLERLLAEFPDPSQLASAHQQAAMCHERLGNLEAAVSEFRLALAALLQNPGMNPGTALEFPWFIIQHRLASLYDEALETLEAADPVFPVQFFQAAAVRAVVAESRRDLQGASRHAQAALQAANLKESPFRYHRSLGLVGEEYQPMLERMAKLVAV